ncbi:hypothetical protein EI534_25960 [Pseudomonas frederiksbergensis]|nr:hypothetical protein [Pseudomonas frederiksbergensis]
MRTLLDTVQPAPVDPLAQLAAKRRQLYADVIDAAIADEAFRRDLLTKLEALGTGKRGRLRTAGRLAYVKTLFEAGFSKREIVQIIERLYEVSERQVERDLKALTAKKP